LEQTTPIPEPDELKNLYETYYNFSGEKETLYTRLRERFLFSPLYRLLMALDGDISFHGTRGSGRLLDLGCNEGRGLVFYRRNGLEAEGLELNERAAEEARKRGFRVYTGSLDEFEPLEPYDVVVLSNVLEHSLAPHDMLGHVARVLKPGGEVWISCPNVESWQRSFFGSYWINWHIPFHIVHLSKDTLARLLRESGFEVRAARQKSPSLWLAQSLIARLFARRGRATRRLRDPVLIATLMVLIRGLFFPILWLGNRLGRGDCLVVAARKV
jgi:SAM-dependent methyltransferase